MKDDIPTSKRAKHTQPANPDSSQSNNTPQSSPLSSTKGLSSFNINLSNNETGDSSSQRPIGGKKAKLKRKISEQFLNTKEDKEFSAMIKKNMESREKVFFLL